MRISPVIVGALIGACVGLIAFAPFVITDRTREEDAWIRLIGGLVCAVMGLSGGLLFTSESVPPKPPDDASDSI